MAARTDKRVLLVVIVVLAAHVWLLGRNQRQGDGQPGAWHRAAKASHIATASPGTVWRVSTVLPASQIATDATMVPVAQSNAAPTGYSAQQHQPKNKFVPAQTDRYGSGAFLPRHLLTKGPQPQEPVVITYPPELVLPGRVSGRLAILIDERGTVRRVEPLDADIPRAMVDAAQAAFMAVRFTPGMRHEKAVRSRIEVEVTFEDGS